MKKSFLGLVLFVLNIPIWILLILALIAPQIAPHYFLPAAFCGLAFLWIWLAALLFTVLLLFFRPKMAVFGLILVLIGIPYAIRHYAFAEKEVISDHSIKVLTFNVQGLSAQYGDGVKEKSVADSIFNFIKNTNSDIICLQEFTSVTNDLDAYMDKFSQSVNAKSYHFQKYYATAHRKPGTLCLVTTSKYPIVQRSAIEIDDYRFGMFTDMVINTDTVRVFNLHLQSTNIKSYDINFVNDILHTNQRQKKSKSLVIRLGNAFLKRESQARLVHQFISQSPYPVIVCGDFNDTPGSYSYQQISKGLKDSFLEAGQGFGQTFNGDLPLMRIDYIFHNDHFQATDFQVHINHYSDHYPVSAFLSNLPDNSSNQ